MKLAQLAGAAEYTDCISEEGWDSPNDHSGYDTKQSNDEAPVTLELWEMQSTPLFAIVPRLTVTLCRWSTKQTIPLSVLAQNQTTGFGLKISGDRKWVREHEKRVGQRSSRKRLVKGDASDQSTPEQRDQSDEMRFRAVREDESRWVGIPVVL